ncbi:CASKIN [Salix koriyanagi]|uniref:CASKIN n=1 Tax=Salix koriyanagi TaxID=2511006 RepID=A0A9Q0TCM9_9ROSI|nr:CASKIN [Salix koriyanagi]
MTDPSSSNATPLEEEEKTDCVPVLESWKYEEWRKKMEGILTSQKLWEVVTSEYERPRDATELSSWNDDRKRKYRTDQNENAKALVLIQRAVGGEIMKEVYVKLQEKIIAKLQEKISANKPKASDQERQSAEWFEKEKFKEPQMVELVATSKDVWETIKGNQKATAEESKKLTMNVDTSLNEQELEEGTKSSLFEYAMRGEWDKVKEIYTRKPAAHCAKITNSGDTALHIAVIDGEYGIAEQLVDIMSLEEARKALVVKNELGNTPLHLAAFVGNAKLCGCIASKVYKINTVKKNQNSEKEEVKSDQKTSNEIEAERGILVEENEEEKEYILLVECNNETEAPLFVAVAQGKTDAFLCLHSYAVPKQRISYYRGNKGDTILHVAVSGEYFDLAFQIIHLYPDLVNMVNERGMSPLHCLARRSTAFRSGYRLPPHYRIIYYCTIVDPLKEKATMQPDSTNRPSPNKNNHLCPDNYETCFHFFTFVSRAFFSFAGQEKLPTTSHDTNNCGHPIQSMISWLKKAFGGGNEADPGSAGESRLVPPNYGTIFELLKLGSKTMLVILGLGSSEIRKIRVKKEKHTWSIQVLDKLLEKNKLYMYERSGSGGGRPSDRTNSSILDPSKQDEGKLAITYKMEKTDTPLLMAARNGITEIMEKILDKYSFAIHDLNSQKKNVVLLAVQYRQTHIYQFLIKRWKKKKIPDRVFRHVDDQGNSAMHHAATMIKDYKPWRIPGAALQMQWEIKWYKFVKNSIRQNFFPLFNHRSETPKEMFSKSHQDLVKSGGEWLTSTSQSCSVVAALIATVAFATLTTVPQRRYVVIVAEKNNNSSPQSDNANQPSSSKSISDKK